MIRNTYNYKSSTFHNPFPSDSSESSVEHHDSNMSNLNASDMFSKWDAADQNNKATVFSAAESSLTGSEFISFKGMVIASKSSIPSVSAGKKPITSVSVSDKDLDAFWILLDNSKMSMYLDEDVINDFKYQGFDANAVLKKILSNGLSAGKKNKEILRDISTMCTIAIIVGSITDHNIKKMSEKAKLTYGGLETTYGLVRGGTKGKDSSVVTVSRVAAAFPGAVMSILIKKPALAKTFAGPFGSKSLPSYLRHQSAAACIPDTLDEKVKEYLLGMITAYTADQTKVLTKSKDSSLELYERQENFTAQGYSSTYPATKVRISLFKQWNLGSVFPILDLVADRIKKVKTDFNKVSADEIERAVSAL